MRGLTQIALMSDSWPVKVCRHIPSLMSQSLAEASQAPDTNSLVSGARERLMTSPVWPANVVVCWPVSMSHRALQESREIMVKLQLQYSKRHLERFDICKCHSRRKLIDLYEVYLAQEDPAFGAWLNVGTLYNMMQTNAIALQIILCCSIFD